MSERLSERSRRERADIVARQTARALGEDGCFRLRIEDVARGAGVGKGTVYLDHQDKGHLIGASLAYMCRELIDQLGRRLESASGPGERLRESIRFLAELPLDRPEVLVVLERRLVCAARWIGADVSPYSELEACFVALVEDARRGGGVPSDVDPRFAAEAILGVVSTSAWRETVMKKGPEHAERQLSRLMPMLLPIPDTTPG